MLNCLKLFDEIEISFYTETSKFFQNSEKKYFSFTSVCRPTGENTWEVDEWLIL